MNKLKECKNCGTLFEKSRSNYKYCSPECRTDYWKKVANNKYREESGTRYPITKVCPQCGKEFTIESGFIRKYCTQECFETHRREYVREKLRERAKKVNQAGRTKYCLNCGKPFIVSPEHVKHCSTECKKKYNIKTSAIIRQKLNGLNYPITQTCSQCGKEFTIESGHIRKYCSQECKGEVKRARLRESARKRKAKKNTEVKKCK